MLFTLGVKPTPPCHPERRILGPPRTATLVPHPCDVFVFRRKGGKARHSKRDSVLRKLQKRLHHPARQFRPISRRHQLMPRSRNHQQLRPRRNKLQCRLHLHLRSESIPVAAYKQSRCLKRREVRRTHLIRPLRRMQWIREQQQPVHESRLLSSQHRCLPAAIRVSTQKNPCWRFMPYRCNCRA